LKKDKERLEELLSLRDREVKDLKFELENIENKFSKENKVLEDKLFKEQQEHTVKLQNIMNVSLNLFLINTITVVIGRCKFSH
jgi:hypothetical protein